MPKSSLVHGSSNESLPTGTGSWRKFAREHEYQLEAIKLQAEASKKAARDARLEAQERPQAIRSFLRS